MANEFPFNYVVKTAYDHRSLLDRIKDEEYKNAKDKGNDLSSKTIQDRIFERFEDKAKKDKKSLEINFKAVVYQRSEDLELYINNIIKEIQSWQGKRKLDVAHFIYTSARFRENLNKAEGIVQMRTVPVTEYYNEEKLYHAITKNTEHFLPMFDGQLYGANTIEFKKHISILSMANITLLYNKKDLEKNNDLFHASKYLIQSRVKTSKRELQKFVDWISALREVNDFPYDGTGAMVSIRDDLSGKLDGSELYKLKDWIFKISPQIPLLFNVNTSTQNASAKIKKLNSDYYDQENYEKVNDQITNTLRIIDQSKKPKYKGPVLSRDEIKKSLLQGIQDKHYIGKAKNDRCETWITSMRMRQVNNGEHIGPNSQRYNERDLDRIAYTKNPALAFDIPNKKWASQFYLVGNLEKFYSKMFEIRYPDKKK